MQRLDVDQMLDEISPETFLEWQIAASMGLDRDGWQMMAELAAAITNKIGVIVNGDKAELKAPSAFLPTGIEA